jgi:hypothetical protein
MSARLLRLLLAVAIIATALVLPTGVANARWRLVADEAVDVRQVCRDGVVFGYAAVQDVGQDPNLLPSTAMAPFLAASPPPPKDINDNYTFPTPDLVVADETLTAPKLAVPLPIDLDDPPNGPDLSFHYAADYVFPWTRTLAVGDDVVISVKDFEEFSISVEAEVEDCWLFVLDIYPGVEKNIVYPGTTRRIPVAVYGNTNLNVKDIKLSSLRFGHTGSEAKPIAWRYRDINSDGYTDLTLTFYTNASGIQCLDTVAYLNGVYTSGQSFSFSDEIATASCKPGKPVDLN